MSKYYDSFVFVYDTESGERINHFFHLLLVENCINKKEKWWNLRCFLKYLAWKMIIQQLWLNNFDK